MAAKKSSKRETESGRVASAAVNAGRFRDQYDAVTGGAKRLRRAPRIETTGENGTDSNQLPPYKRLQLINLCRDAERNFSFSKAIVRQLCANVAGTDFKLRIKIADQSARAAEEWFNTVFAHACDFRADKHLSDFNRTLLRCVVVDGDAGLAFDGPLLDTGRLIAYESDQICDPDSLPPGVARSSDGVLLDSFGREIGYFTARENGRMRVPLTEGTVWPRDPMDGDNGSFKLLRMPWRFNATRGTSELFSCVADILDCYEMRSKELQSAKVAASFGIAIKKKDAGVGADITNDPRLNPLAPPPAAAPAETQSPAADVSAPAAEPLPNYVEMEALAGGRLSYLDPSDDIQVVDPSSRPNLNSDEFTRRVIKSAAAGMGFAQCYALLEANTSYTAFRGEMIMSWVTIRLWQKWYERNVQDWEARHAISFAIAKGMIPSLPTEWRNAMVWTHPTMPAVDPLKDQQAFLQALKNGATSLQQMFGPDYVARLDEIEEEIAAFKKLGIPHPIFQTTSGSVIADAGNGNDGNKGDNSNG